MRTFSGAMSTSVSGKEQSIVKSSDIPWPEAGDESPLPGASSMNAGELKVALRDLQRRWHPDKWSKFKLNSGERESILRRVVAISQTINAIEI